MPTLAEIESRAQKYAVARDTLRGLVETLKEGMDALQKQHLPGIRKALNKAAEQEAELKALVEQAPGLFVKPKSVIFHGIKLGFQKGKGKIEWDDADRVVALIRKHFPEQADVLIATSERPAKDALAQLSVAELKKLGVSVTEAGEAVFVKPTDSAVDKMVESLMKAAADEATA